MQLELKQIRNQYGLSQTYVADLLGVNQTTMARWESGDLPLSQRRRLELIDIFMNKRGRIDRAIEQMIRGRPYVPVFDADNRFIHTSEQLARAAKQNRADIIGRRSHKFDDTSWHDEVYGDTDVEERLFVQFAFDLRRKNAPADQAICRLRCKEFWLEFEDSAGIYVMFANVVPASGEQARPINLLNASDFESG